MPITIIPNYPSKINRDFDFFHHFFVQLQMMRSILEFPGVLNGFNVLIILSSSAKSRSRSPLEISWLPNSIFSSSSVQLSRLLPNVSSTRRKKSSGSSPVPGMQPFSSVNARINLNICPAQSVGSPDFRFSSTFNARFLSARFLLRITIITTMTSAAPTNAGAKGSSL